MLAGNSFIAATNLHLSEKLVVKRKFIAHFNDFVFPIFNPEINPNGCFRFDANRG